MKASLRLFEKKRSVLIKYLQSAVYVLGIFTFLAFGFVTTLGVLGSKVFSNLNLCGKVPIQGCGNLLSTLTYSVAIVIVQVLLTIIFHILGQRHEIEIIPGIWRSRKNHGLLFLGFSITVFTFLLAIVVEAILPIPWTNITWIDHSSKPLSDVSFPVVAWVTVFAAAFWEELLFRGYSMQFLRNHKQEWIGGGVSSLLFAVFHSEARSLPNLLFFLTFGFTLFLCYQVTRSIWLSAGVHFGWNLMLGMHAYGSIFWQADLAYPDWWVSFFGDGMQLPFFFVICAVLLVLGIWKRSVARQQQTSFASTF
jgi:membrane protease YdiL (CAAX protease family)